MKRIVIGSSNPSDNLVNDLYTAIVVETLFNYQDFDLDRSQLEAALDQVLDRFFEEKDNDRFNMIQAICQVYDEGLSRYTSIVDDALHLNNYVSTDRVEKLLYSAAPTDLIKQIYDKMRNLAKVDSDLRSSIAQALEVRI